LDLSGLFELSRLPPELERLTFLQGLDLSQCYSLGDLEPLAKLIHLQTLHLVDLSDPSLLASLTSLQELSSFHYGLRDLASLASLTSLQTLDLDHCEQLSGDLSPLAPLPP